MKNEKRLSELSVGECGRVLRLVTAGSMRRRFLDIGLSPGTAVLCVGRSPFGDPSAYLIRCREVAIRRIDAESVILE